MSRQRALALADIPGIPDALSHTTYSQPGSESEIGNEPTITIVDSQSGQDSPVQINPDGSAVIRTPDGGAVVIENYQAGEDQGESSEDFNENLADKIEAIELSRIGSELVEQIRADDETRTEWIENRAKGMEMLGFKLEDPRGDAGTQSAPIEGMATVRHTLLAEAVIRFQSNASAEMLPPSGPVKVRVDGGETDQTDSLAEALERDFNHFLTTVDKGYRADTDRALFSTGFGGCSFKKVYRDPIKRMPLSRSVDAADLIVSNNVSDMDDAGRITHRIVMRPSMLKRMQLAGAYRDVPLSSSTMFQPTRIEEKTAEIQGIQINSGTQRPEDIPYTVYESYCELNIKGFEHRDDNGKITGLAVPYRVVVEKESMQVLEIRRNYREDDPFCLPKKVFVKYPFVPAFGFYEIGLLQILGNADRALTGAWRVMLDNGMYSNFPGFIYSDMIARQVTNEFRVPPGGGVKLNTGGMPLSNVIMPIPSRSEAMAPMLGLVQAIEVAGQRLGGTAELQVAEGRQDAPVGTTMAMVEQATKMLAAVHIRLHAAQSEEFQLLKELFREDPEALWRFNRTPAKPWEVQEFLQALDDYDLVPASDPNTPSHMHRILKIVGLMQLAAAAPQLYDLKAVHQRALKALGFADAATLFVPPQPAPEMAPMGPSPDKVLEVQAKAAQQQAEGVQRDKDRQAEIAQAGLDHKARLTEIALESRDRQADRASREQVANVKAHTEIAKLAHTAQQQERDRAADAAQQTQQHAHEADQQTQQRQHDAAQQAQQQAQQQAPGGHAVQPHHPPPVPFSNPTGGLGQTPAGWTRPI